ncbi:crotonase/enoyl-CoA hydratase family protein [Parafrankia elaeagni]|uniref:crotonase/enoyl-CoA hydratase family protein n=1 Tax=Parafrankia elaeagni TaxID=222534 RepID=UPI000377A2DB|nr:crotonase/enoyl-CoA hydratase family protein [Parafrankia elaeagni]
MGTTQNMPAALYEVRDNAAVVTLNRPDALNAVNADLATAVGEGLEAAAADRDVRVVVITGSGRAFCAGADLKEIAQQRSVAAHGHPEWGFAGIVQHWIDKPVIAAVNGFAMGGGTEIALACDLVVAADTATFGLPEVKRGLLAAAGGVVRLQRQLPLKLALELALTGDAVDAATAHAWGLVNQVVPAGDVLDAALSLAGRIAVNAPLSLQHTKRMIHRTLTGASDWDASWVGEDPWLLNAEAMKIVFGSRDALEGSQAFAQKRPPSWQGR